MKFLVFVLAMVFAFETFANAFGHNSFDGTGAVKSRSKDYRFYKNSASSAFAEGNVICADLTDDDGISADFCASEGDDAALGMVDEACAVGDMCKVLVEGFTDKLTYDGSGDSASAGDALYADINGKAAGVTVDTTAEAAYKKIGFIYDAASTSVDVEAYIRVK